MLENNPKKKPESKSNYIEERPWGKFEIFADNEKYKVKRLTVYPKSKLSLQSHKHRSENWVVVRGIAKVVNGDKEIILQESESTFIPVGNKHRLENPGEEDLVLIEVQTGDYFGEDDIVRYEDIYNRIEDSQK
jgi:mannose-1-phosphate guanylyltransferase / mannose-6-phosphate isomerase